jgi:hypothetical protein
MSARTVGELIALLEDYDPESPIMIAHQESWPLAETVASVVGDTEVADEETYEAGSAADPETVWIVAGGHAWDRSPYAPRAVFEGAR